MSWKPFCEQEGFHNIAGCVSMSKNTQAIAKNEAIAKIPRDRSVHTTIAWYFCDRFIFSDRLGKTKHWVKQNSAKHYKYHVLDA